MTQPLIQNIEAKRPVGNSLVMSMLNDKTLELWRSFSPRIKEISGKLNEVKYSVQQFKDPTYFDQFDPHKEFTKWAAVEVSEGATPPDGMKELILPAGDYTVFTYVGKPSEAQEFLQYIYSKWIIESEYSLDDRPHFALMDHRYKGEDPESCEEFWIPIKK